MEYRWIEVTPGRQRRIRVEEPRPNNRSALPLPIVIRPFSEPVRSMANGKLCDTPRELEATYRASGNPQGKEYECVGDDPLPTFKRPTVDRKAQRDAIERAICDVDAGNVPRVLTTDDYPL